MISQRQALIATFIVSFGLLVDEIMLSAIFHVLLGAGNTVAAIAIGLVGLAGGGIVAYAIPSLHAPERSDQVLRRLLLVFTLTLVVSVYAIMAVPISHGDLIYQRTDPSVQLWRLAVYHITVAPFLIGGITLSVLFRSRPDAIGRLYFGDLLGASAGCLASPLLLSTFGAPAAVLVGALPAAVLSGWLIVSTRTRLRILAPLPLLLAGLVFLDPSLLTFRTINSMGEVANPAYRSFRIEEGDIAFERWALDAWTIIRGEEMTQQWENFKGWGLSPHYDGPIPETRLVNYNARFSTYVTDRSGDPEELGTWLDADLSSLHHLIGRHYDEVANIGAGGGREVLAALQHGAKLVVAVDVSEVVVEDIMKGYLREFSGDLYLDPRVEAIADEGRSFMERTQSRFDLIEFSIVGGMNLEKMDLVRVDDLFTLEALETYVDRLEDDGVFSYVMYSTRSDIVDGMLDRDDPQAQPYIPALRELVGVRMAIEAAEPGAVFSDHVLIAALPRVINPSYDLVHIVVSRAPFSPAETARFVEAVERLGFKGLHPATGAEAEAANLYARIANVPDLEALAAEIPFRILPASDDRPFQYALDPHHVVRALRRGELISLLSGNPLVSMGLSIGGLAVAITLTPLLLGARRREHLGAFRASWRMLLYFACIGFGYMGVEIAVLLELQSFLGKPIYGLSVGLFAFLLASGLGSFATNRLPDERLPVAVAVLSALIVAVGLVFVATSGALFANSMALPLTLRIAVAVAAIFPIAFLMGTLFPIGVRLIARDSESLIPWAWATNGCFSVLGIFSTRITALLFGFSRSLLVGLAVYLLVILCVRGQGNRRDAATS